MAHPDDLHDPTYHIRRRAVDWAVAQDGSHYLHGAWGHCPSYAGGDGPGRAPFRHKEFNMHPIDLTPGHRFVHTAWWPHGDRPPGRANGIYYCAGRCDNPEVMGRPHGNPADARPTDGTGIGQLWPRFMAVAGRAPAEVWGEPCMGARHFDCITLVLMALQAATHELHRREIRHFGDTPIHPGQPPLTRDVGFDHIWTADILVIGDHHIAMATGDGRVVQAEDTHIGVTVKQLRGRGRFTRCGRLPRGFWSDHAAAAERHRTHGGGATTTAHAGAAHSR